MRTNKFYRGSSFSNKDYYIIGRGNGPQEPNSKEFGYFWLGEKKRDF